MTWNDMKWHEMTWHDMTWHDMTWHSMTLNYFFRMLTRAWDFSPWLNLKTSITPGFHQSSSTFGLHKKVSWLFQLLNVVAKISYSNKVPNGTQLCCLAPILNLDLSDWQGKHSSLLGTFINYTENKMLSTQFPRSYSKHFIFFVSCKRAQ